MPRLTRIGSAALVGVLFFSLASARADVLIGAGATSGNAFPFNANISSGTRYQQVYDSSFFAGPTVITSISFFNANFPGAVFQTADYTISLSTSNFGVDLLNTSDLNANPGSDAALFASVHLSGATGAKFTILAGGGGSAFAYDPSHGDLLVDIVRTNVVMGTGSGYLDAYSGDANGIFSRAHNFGSGFEGYGLKTEFGTQAVPEPASVVLGAFGLAVVGLIGRRVRRVATDC